MFVTELQPRGDVLADGAETAMHTLADRLQGLKAVCAGIGVNADALPVAVVHGDEYIGPALGLSNRLAHIGAQHHILAPTVMAPPYALPAQCAFGAGRPAHSAPSRGCASPRRWRYPVGPRPPRRVRRGQVINPAAAREDRLGHCPDLPRVKGAPVCRRPIFSRTGSLCIVISATLPFSWAISPSWSSRWRRRRCLGGRQSAQFHTIPRLALRDVKLTRRASRRSAVQQPIKY